MNEYDYYIKKHSSLLDLIVFREYIEPDIYLNKFLLPIRKRFEIEKYEHLFVNNQIKTDEEYEFLFEVEKNQRNLETTELDMSYTNYSWEDSIYDALGGEMSAIWNID